MPSPAAAWRRFAALPNEHPAKTLLIVGLVALVCAAGVSFSAVSLRPLQQQQRDARLAAQRAEVLNALPAMAELLKESAVDALEVELIELATGRPASAEAAAGYDPQAASGPEWCVALPREQDLAGIGCVPRLLQVQMVRSGADLVLLVLPIYAKGYQSTLRASLVLEADLNTIAALQIEEQGETPGLGARIAEPEWQASFAGRQLRDDQGGWRFAVVREAKSTQFEVDAIAGATRSSDAIGRAIRFWLGPQGFAPLIERLEQEQGR